ncbi:hypothetical protein SCOR_34195 [Sulfidibacter corallicola]|uniref:Fibronectin type-III domain-containing protein n=1 Tax=Sulfidibacter corallicola TaxID=2818388 RepID=A0A8A4TS91_SULCO|nr:CARDB domain-containing protein [Sulfidibacter corallicola]QTD49415.1 hypothetical protein J3U87_27840 [Sulfidibacter corallicola]
MKRSLFRHILLLWLGAVPLGFGVIHAGPACVVSPNFAQGTESTRSKMPDARFQLDRVVGNVAVFRFTGDPQDFGYQALGPLNPELRQAMMGAVYQHFGDLYHFAVLTSDFTYIEGVQAFYLPIRNDVAGIGLENFDRTADFHSAGRLQGLIELGALDKFATGGLVDALSLRDVLLHELGHRWLAHARFLDGGSPSADLLSGSGHWSYWLDSDASRMYGHDWARVSDDTWQARGVELRYSDLDLYLMGFLPEDRVAPLTLLRPIGTASPPDSPLSPGREARAAAETIEIDRLTAAMGPREPAYDGRLQSFRVLFIYLYAEQAPSTTTLAQVELGLGGAANLFREQTRGLGHLDFRPAPIAADRSEPDTAVALTFLQNRRGSTGLWADHEATLVRDSSAAIRALARFGVDVRAELDLLASLEDRNVDETARILATLSHFNRADEDRLTDLLDAQGDDGGFALRSGFRASPLDTALALGALNGVAETRAREAADRAVSWLLERQAGDGAWGLDVGAAYETAEVLAALAGYSGSPSGLEEARTRATNWLLGFQGAHGGLGQTDVDFAVTCAVLRALVAAGGLDTAAKSFLERAQTTAGGWNDLIHDTAIVLETLDMMADTESPDPALDRASITLVPANPVPGLPLTVSAEIRNLGSGQAEDLSLTLYRGEPEDGGEQLDRATLGQPLAAGAAARLETTWTLPDDVEAFTLVLVVGSSTPDAAPANNRLSFPFHFNAPTADARLDDESLVLSSLRPVLGETFRLRVRVENTGRLPLSGAALSLFDGDPNGSGQRIAGPLALPDLVAITGNTVAELDWVVDGPTGLRNLFVHVDTAEDPFPENNTLRRTIDVLAEAGGVDVAVDPLSVVATPNVFETAPQSLRLSYRLVDIGGTGPQSVTSALYLGDPAEGGRLVAQRVDALAPGGNFDAELTTTLEHLADYDLVLLVDTGTDSDVRPENNRHVLRFDGAAFNDFELVPDSLSLTPGLISRDNRLRVTVRNRHLQPRTGVPVLFSADSGGGFAPLGRATVDLPGAGTAVAELVWPAPAETQSGTLRADLDPDAAWPELDEGDNRLEIPYATRADDQANLHLGSDAIALSDPPYREGGRLEVRVTVRNTGGVAADGRVNLYLASPEGASIAPEQTVAALQPGEGRLVTFAIDPIAFRGEQVLVAQVATDDPESDADDNTAYRPLFVTGGPNAGFGPTPMILDPVWPAVGETVTVRVALQNGGGQSAEDLVVALYADDRDSVPLDQTQLDLQPGSAEVALTFVVPADLERLVCVLDPENLIAEQVETDNTAYLGFTPRSGEIAVDRTVFSPNGDGAADSVTLFWNTEEPEVDIALLDGSGRRQQDWRGRQGSGSLVWNGLGADGKALSDGYYVFRLSESASGFAIADITVSLDTNNTRIREALASPDPGFFDTLTSAFVGGSEWAGWAEDGSALIGRFPSGPPIVVAPDGGAFEEWYIETDQVFTLPGQPGRLLIAGPLDYFDFPYTFTVAVYGPNQETEASFELEEGHVVLAWANREQVLVAQNGTQLFLIDLDDGERHELHPAEGQWDQVIGGFAYQGHVYVVERRNGSAPRLVRLAPDGTGFREIYVFEQAPTGGFIKTLHRDRGYLAFGLQASEFSNPVDLVWFHIDSGRAFRWLEAFPDAEPDPTVALSDGRLIRTPETSGSTDVVVLLDWPSGSRYPVYDSGQPDSLINLLQGLISPDGAKIATREPFPEQGLYTTRHNLGLIFEAFTLSGGVVRLQGTATDRHFRDWVIEAASLAEPDTWIPTGMSGDFSVVNGFLGNWLPEDPGAYLLRLTARDRAGNERRRLVSVRVQEQKPFYDAFPDHLLISPNGDGVADAVTMQFQVRAAFEANLTVSDSEGRPLFQSQQFFGAGTQGSLTWHGRDAGGAVAPDGLYRLDLNGIAFQVTVDTTPPELTLALDPPRRERNQDDVLTIVTRYALEVDDLHLASWRLERRRLEDVNWTVVRAEHAAYATNPGNLDRLDTLEQVFEQEFRLVAEDHAGNRATFTTGSAVAANLWLLAGPDDTPFLGTDGSAPILAQTAIGGLENLDLVALVPRDRFPLTLTALEYGGDTDDLVTLTELDAERSLFEGPRFQPGLAEANLPSDRDVIFRLVCQDRLGGTWRSEFMRRLILAPRIDFIGLEPDGNGAFRVDYQVSVDKDSGVRTMSGRVLGGVDVDRRFDTPIVLSARPFSGNICKPDRYRGMFFQADWPDNLPPNAEPGLVRKRMLLENVVFNPGEPDEIALGTLTVGTLCGINTVTVRPLYDHCRDQGQSRRTYLVAEAGDTPSFPAISLFADAAGTVPLALDLRPPLLGERRFEMDQTELQTEGEHLVYAVVRDREGHNIRISPTLGRAQISFELVETLDSTEPLVQLAGIIPFTPEPIEIFVPDQVMCAPSERELQHALDNRVPIARELQVSVASASHAPQPSPSHLGMPVFSAWAVPVGRDTPRVEVDLSAPAPTEFPTIDIAPWAAAGYAAWELHLQAINDAGFCNEVTAVVQLSGDAESLAAGLTLFTVGSDAVTRFSPNGDGRRENAIVPVGLEGSLQVAAWIESFEGVDQPPVRLLRGGGEVGPGRLTLHWDGRNDAGERVAEGAYRLVVAGYASCGTEVRRATTLHLDTSLPELALLSPAAGAVTVPSGVRVDASDASELAWVRLTAAPAEAPNQANILADLTRPTALSDRRIAGLSVTAPGDYLIHLSAEDLAGNRAETSVVVTVALDPVIARWEATGDLLSPNDDGRQDGVVLRYELRAAANLTLTAQGPQTHVLRADVPAGIGSGEWFFDGRVGGANLPDGSYTLMLSATTDSGVNSAELDVQIDTRAPSMTLSEPEADTVNNLDRVPVVVTLSDGSGSGVGVWDLAFETPGQARVVVAEGSGALDGRTLVELDQPNEGLNRLFFTAADVAGNVSTRQVDFYRDRTAPRLRIDVPVANHVVSLGQTLNVAGTFEEAFPEDLVLSLVHEDESDPRWRQEWDAAALADLAEGSFAASVAVDDMPDGRYTLRAHMIDRVGLTGTLEVPVAIDTRPPEVALDALPNGGLLAAPVEIRGTARDLQLAWYELALLPLTQGKRDDRDKEDGFVTLFRGAEPVTDGVLFAWTRLPPDGTYRLRLRAADAAGSISETSRDLVVDRTPPGPPTGLLAEAALLETPAFRSAVTLTWASPGDGDVFGYRVYRNGTSLTEAPQAATSFRDEPVRDGLWLYQVRAIDLAGNLSESAEVELLVDATPPVPSLSAPVNGQVVGGLLDVVGSVYDERLVHWSLHYGVGVNPQNWLPLAEGTENVGFGLLAQWAVAGLVEGPHLLRFRASDASGNVGERFVEVRVENQPPAKPATPTVAALGSNPGRLRVTWAPNADADVAAYRVFRDGAYIGRVDGFSTAWLDPPVGLGDLPDGTYTYQVGAVDQAGNESALSDPSDPYLHDREAPHVAFLRPLDGARFESDLTLEAVSNAQDIQSVRFQYKLPADVDWTDIATDGEQPWLVNWTPAIEDGEIQLRAVAEEQGSGELDPAPPVITVTKGDTTAPAAPAITAVRLRGDRVELDWETQGEADLDRIHLMRNGALAADLDAATSTFADSGLAAGTYRYHLVAVDTAGNSSQPGESRQIMLFAPTLDEPALRFETPAVAIEGSGATAPFETVELREGTEVLATAQVNSVGRFRIELSLPEPGLFTYRVVQRDGQDNESLHADMTVIRVRPAEAATDLQVVSDGGDPADAILSWQPPAVDAAYLAGYHLSRGEAELQPLVSMSAAQFAEVRANGVPVASLTDGDAGTLWQGRLGANEIVFDFAQPAAYAGLRIEWDTSHPIPASLAVRLESHGVVIPWRALDLPLGSVFDTRESGLVDQMPLTGQVILRLDATEGAPAIRELSLYHQPLIAPAATGYTDSDPGTGRHEYRLTTRFVDGGSAEIGPVVLSLGDVEAPLPPSQLVVSLEGADARLAWVASPSADVAFYRVYRDDRGLADAVTTAYVDAALHSGTFAYRVTAVDGSGNESEPSETVSVTLSGGVATAPVLTAEVDADGSVLLVWNYDRESTGFDGFTVERRFLEDSGFEVVGPGDGQTLTDLVFRDTGSLPANRTLVYRVAVLDVEGRATYSNLVSVVVPLTAPTFSWPASAGSRLTLYRGRTELTGFGEPGGRVQIHRNGRQEVEATALSFDRVRDLGLVDREPQRLVFGAQGIVLVPSAVSRYMVIHDPESQSSRSITASRRFSHLTVDDEGVFAAFVDAYSDATGFAKLLHIASGEVLTVQGGFVTGPLLWRRDGRLWVVNGATISMHDPSSGQTEALFEHDEAISQLIDAPAFGGVLVVSGEAPVRVALLRDDLQPSLLLEREVLRDPVWADGARRLVWRDGSERCFALGFTVDARPNTAEPVAIPLNSQIERLVGISGDGRFLFAATSSGLPVAWDISGLIPRVTSLPESDRTVWGFTKTRRDTLLFASRDGIDFRLFEVRLAGWFQAELSELDPGENRIRANVFDPMSLDRGPFGADLVLDVSRAHLPDAVTSYDQLRFVPAAASVGQTVAALLNVRNGGGGDLRDLEISWTLVGPDENPRFLPSSTLPLLAAGAYATVGLDLDTRHWEPGRYRLRATLDGRDAIEELDETNNGAAHTFVVTDEAGLALDLATETDPIDPLADLELTARVVNTGAAASGLRVLVRLETLAGELLHDFEPWETGTLVSFAERDHAWRHSTASWLAGTYRLVGSLYRGDDLVGERSLEVTLRADARLEADLSGLPGRIGAGADLRGSIAVRNTSGNYAFRRLQWALDIEHEGTLAPGAGGVAPVLLPGGGWDLEVTVAGADLPQGEVTLWLALTEDGQTYRRVGHPLTVTNVARYAAEASLYPTPGAVTLPQSIRAAVALRNTGNRALSLPLVVRLLDLDDSVLAEAEWLAEAEPHETVESVLVFDGRGLVRGTYRLHLHNRDQGSAPVAVSVEALVQVRTDEVPVLRLEGLPAEGYTAESVAPVVVVEDDQDPLPEPEILLNHQPFAAGGVVDDEGVYYLEATVVDGNNNRARVEETFYVDRSQPELTVTGVEDGGTYGAAVHPRFEVTDLTPVRVAATLNDQPFLSGTEVAELGEYVLVVIAVDRLDHRTETRVAFTLVDGDEDLVQFTGIADGTAYRMPVTVDIQLANGASLEAFTVNETSATAPLQLTEEGVYRLEARAVRGEASQTVRAEIEIDTTVPEIVKTGVEDGGYYRESVFPVILVDGEPAESSQVTLNGAPFASGSEVAAEGVYTLAVSAVDRAGNTASSSCRFTIDRTAPELRVFGVEDGQTYVETLLITWQLVDDWPGTVTATLDGEPVQSPLSIVQSGQYTLVLHGNDLAGNTHSSRYDFVVDGVEPLVVIEPVRDGDVLRGPVTITISVSDTARASYEAFLNGQPFVSGQTLTMEGEYLLRVEALGSNDSVLVVERRFTLDQTPPQILIEGVADGQTYDTPVTPVVTVEELHPGTVELTLNGTSFVSGTTVSAHGTYRLDVVAIDLAGNRGERSLTFALGDAPPLTIEVEGVADGGFYADSVTPVIRFVGEEITETEITLNGATFASATPVAAEGEYALRARAANATGERAEVSVDFVIDRTAPVVVISGVEDGVVYDRPVQPRISIEEAWLAETLITLDEAPFNSGTVISADGSYLLRVVALDRAGNRTERQVAFDLELQAPLSLTPETLVFGDSEVAVEQPFLIANHTAQKVALGGVEIGGEGARAFSFLGFASPTVPPFGNRSGTIRFLAPAQGRFEAELVIQVEGVDMSELVLPMMGTRGTPDLVVAPLELNFDRVDLGKVGRRRLHLRNDADRLVALDVAGQDEHYQLEGDTPIELEPGSSREVVVRFVPDRAGNFGSTIELAEIGGARQFQIALCGTGVDVWSWVALPHGHGMLPSQLHKSGEHLWLRDDADLAWFHGEPGQVRGRGSLGTGRGIRGFWPVDERTAYFHLDEMGFMLRRDASERQLTCGGAPRHAVVEPASGDLLYLDAEGRLMRLGAEGNLTESTVAGALSDGQWLAVHEDGDLLALDGAGMLYRGSLSDAPLAAWFDLTPFLAGEAPVALVADVDRGSWLCAAGDRLLRIDGNGRVETAFRHVRPLRSVVVQEGSPWFVDADRRTLWRWENGGADIQWTSENRAYEAVAVDGGGGRIFSIDGERLVVHHIESGARQVSPERPGLASVIRLAYDGDLFGLEASGRILRIRDDGRTEILAEPQVTGAPHGFVAAEGNLAAVTEDGLFGLRSGAPFSIPVGFTIEGVTAIPGDRNTVLVGEVDSSQVRRIDLASGQEVGMLAFARAPRGLLCLGPEHYRYQHGGTVYEREGKVARVLSGPDPIGEGCLLPGSPVDEAWYLDGSRAQLFRLMPYAPRKADWGRRHGVPLEADIDGSERIDVLDLIWQYNTTRGN